MREKRKSGIALHVQYENTLMKLLYFKWSHHGDHAAGPDAVAHAHHAHVVSVLSPPQEVLITHVVGAVIHHKTASLHPAGMTPAQIGGHIGAVALALIGTALEVPVLVEDDLRR